MLRKIICQKKLMLWASCHLILVLMRLKTDDFRCDCLVFKRELISDKTISLFSLLKLKLVKMDCEWMKKSRRSRRFRRRRYLMNFFLRLWNLIWRFFYWSEGLLIYFIIIFLLILFQKYLIRSDWLIFISNSLWLLLIFFFLDLLKWYLLLMLVKSSHPIVNQHRIDILRSNFILLSIGRVNSFAEM